MNALRTLGCWLLLGPAAAQQASPTPFPPPIWNSPAAMLRLGNAYSRGQGAPLDEPMALRCYQRAAELGSLVATDNVGTYYAMGRGTPASRAQALAWYRRAAKGGYVPAMNNLGVLYSSAVQGQPDHCQALAWFKKAAEGGNATGMWHLGQAYQRGLCPRRQSAQLARQWLQNAIDIGSRPGATAADKYAAEHAAQDVRQLPGSL